MGFTSDVERIRYRFLGHVQHRGFRFACVVCAERVHMTGWVRNERDGTVTAEIQGPNSSHLDFIKQLSDLVPGFGSTWSIGTERRVDLVDDEQGFGVRRY